MASSLLPDVRWRNTTSLLKRERVSARFTSRSSSVEVTLRRVILNETHRTLHGQDEVQILALTRKLVDTLEDELFDIVCYKNAI